MLTSKKFVAAVLALIVSTASYGQEATSTQSDARKELWNGLRVGMTKAEGKAILPKALVPLGNGCHIVAYPQYDKTGLHRINMEWSVKDRPALRCGMLVKQVLAEKYGQPIEVSAETKFKDCGNTYARGVAGAIAGLCETFGGDKPETYSYALWVSNGIEISFKMEMNSDDPYWYAVYRLEPVADPSMKDKF